MEVEEDKVSWKTTRDITKSDHKLSPWKCTDLHRATIYDMQKNQGVDFSFNCSLLCALWTEVLNRKVSSQGN